MKIGDAVTLRSGGPVMTVIKVLEDQVTVAWHAGSALQQETFSAAALTLWRARER
jgi:uncharacterized protein YodC (DUF2158 family)